MAQIIQVKRGTRTQLNAAAAASGLKVGEPYLITDENRLAVGLSATTYAEYALAGHTHSGVYEPADATILKSTAIGSTVQGYDADLAALAGLSTTGLVERTGAGTAETVTITTAGKALLDDADAATQRTTLGVGTGNGPQFAVVNLGHATDTTLARSAAGQVTIEGVEITTASNTQTMTNKTLTDPAIIGAITEDIYTIADGAAFEIDPSNGTLQNVTLGASRTPKATNFAAGESVVLRIKDGSAYAITWTDTTFGTSGVSWIGGTAPTLDTTNWTVVVLWKEGSQVYGNYVGVVA